MYEASVLGAAVPEGKQVGAGLAAGPHPPQGLRPAENRGQGGVGAQPVDRVDDRVVRQAVVEETDIEKAVVLAEPDEDGGERPGGRDAGDPVVQPRPPGRTVREGPVTQVFGALGTTGFMLVDEARITHLRHTPLIKSKE
ncbi:hypothetical protein [Streptomyces acidiscabies]|uniref:hypothetical protein n=1 Tax=Streptomyces acidiscabies TaxID=42234 RepID=UPI0038F6432A